MIITGSAYSNGNYYVTRQGSTMTKRCFRVGEDFIPEFPDSIDLKISNRCSIGCPYCHEKSEGNGKIAKFEEIVEHLSSLPTKGIEIAIGGGNVLEDKESIQLLDKLIKWFSSRRNLVNITLSEKSITPKSIGILNDLKVNWSNTKMGLGISLGPDITEERLKDLSSSVLQQTWSWDWLIVFHVILGLIPLSILKLILSDNYLFPSYNRILFLGYKQYGRAKNTDLPESLPTFETIIKRKIIEGREVSDGMLYRKVLGFDNLAIEQLNLSGSFLDSSFRDIYLGPDFSCSMYVDAVNGQFAKNSTSDDRVSWNDIDILDYFKHDKGKI